MRPHLIAVAVLVLPVAASIARSQTPPTPPAPTSAGTQGVREVVSKTPVSAPRMSPGSPTEAAQRVMAVARGACRIREFDGKLFADCDNTTVRARMTGPTQVPQTNGEWERFARSLHEADKTITGRGRPVVVLNQGVSVVEVTTAGVVQLKK